MNFIHRKYKIYSFLVLIAINLPINSNAHVRGTFTSEQGAQKKSLELGCKGIHQNKDKWLPCENEQELHKYLRK